MVLSAKISRPSRWNFRESGPSCIVSIGYPRHPSPWRTLASVYMWKRFPYRPSQSWPCMIIHNLYWIIICADILHPLSFRRSFYPSMFCEINLHFFDTFFCFKPVIVTLATLRVVPGRRAKVFIWRKVVPAARVTLPAELSLIYNTTNVSLWSACKQIC